jgi:hypothetical protein
MPNRRRQIRQRAQRARNQQSITDPITDPKDVRREVRAATNLEFRPLQRQLGGEVRASRQRERDIGSWFGQAGRQIRRVTRATGRDYRNTGKQVRNDIASATGASALTTAALNAQDAELAKLTGAAYDPSASQTSQAAAAQRALLQTSIGGMLRAQGASQKGYLRGQRVNTRREGIHQRLLEGKRRQSIRDDQREVARARGEFARTERGRIRGEERDYQIERMAFTTPSQYDRTVRQQSRNSLAGDLAYANSQRYVADQGVREQQAANRGYRNLPRGGGGDEGGGISEREAMGYLRQSAPRGGYKSRAQAIDILVNRGVDARTARRVVARAYRRDRSGGGGNDVPRGSAGFQGL